MLKFYRILLLPLTTVFLASAAGVARYAADSCTQSRMYRQLAALTEDFPDDATSTGNNLLPQYQALYAQNSDLAGWIQIDGTNINYPVMQSKHDPDFYLKHNFEKADSPHGCPYVQANCNLQTPSDNILVYGHNMKDGTMFSDLLQYKRESFWQQHRIIQFDTLTAQAEYTVMAVFQGEAEDLFAYYQFANAETPQEFAAYVDACKGVALYETGVSAAYYLMLRDRSIYLTAVGTALKWSAYTGEEEQMFTILEPGTGSDGSDSGEVSNVPDSKLVTKFIPAYEGNYTKDRKAQGGTISEITIHHCASILTIDALGALWQREGRKGSSHYGVSETNIGQYVHESDVAWTNGNWEANCRAVTIETSNSGGAPEWPVSDTTFQTLVTLVADIARRNGLGKLVKGKNLTWHSMYAATACPGPYLSGKLQELVDKANTINGF